MSIEPGAHQWNQDATNWDVNDVHQLANGSCTPVVYNMDCNCGMFQSGNTSECLSESWLRNGVGGAVASFAFGSTIDESIATGMCTTMVRALCDTWRFKGSQTSLASPAYAAPAFDLGGQFMLLAGALNGMHARKTMARYMNLAGFLGDPTMAVWVGGTPEPIAVAGLPDTMLLNTPYSLTLTVNDSATGQHHIVDAIVCACGAGVYTVARTDSNGQASLSFTPTKVARLSITVSEGHEIGASHTPALPMQRIYYLNCWREMAAVRPFPSGKNVRSGAWLTYDTNSGLVFGAKGNNKQDFYSFHLDGDTWHPQWNWPRGHLDSLKNPKDGAAGCCDGQGHIYAVKGHNSRAFWEYFVSGDSWHEIDSGVPHGLLGHWYVTAGSGLAYATVGGTGFVYLMKGGTLEFYRFNTATRLWSACAPVPGCRKLEDGSFLVYNSADSCIYLHKSHYDSLYKFNPSTGGWVQALAGMPTPGSDGNRRAGSGSCGACLGGYIYALKGGGSRQFWQCDPRSGAWTELDTMPLHDSAGSGKSANSGGSIVSVPGLGLYALKGNNSRSFLYHPPTTGGLYAGRSVAGGSISCAGGPTLDQEQPLMDGLQASKPRWNQQGTMVCYSKVDTLSNQEQIYQCPYPAGVPEQRVENVNEDCDQPVYSPNGMYVAFRLDDAVSQFYQLCVTTTSGLSLGADPRGPGRTSVCRAAASDATGTASATAGDAARPATAGSTRVLSARDVVSANPGESGSKVTLGVVVQVTFTNGDHCSPEWSPDGAWLCYERDDSNGYTQICRVPAFGGPEQQLTFDNADHFLPSYLNANEIVFTYSPNNGYDQVAKVNITTLQTTVLSSLQTDHGSPDPSWNGLNVVAAACDGSGTSQIVKVTNSGANETWLTSGASDITAPNYGQDNRTIAAVRWTGITSQIVWVDGVNGGYVPVTDTLAIRDNPDAY